MALDMEGMLAELTLGVAQEWMRYAQLEDGTQIKATFHRDGELEWLEVHDAEQGGDLLGRFQVSVTVTPFELPPIGPEDDGALRAELAEQAPEPDWVSRTWAEACEGDAAQGGDGTFYPVVHAAAGTGPNAGFQVVTLLVGGQERVYNMPPGGDVNLIRGEVGQRLEAIRAAGLGPEVITS